MRYYRIYSLTDGHVVEPPTVIRAADDKEAIRRAEQLLDGHDLQVLDEKRLVAKLKAKG